MADTWTHRLARLTVRPLLGTPVTPNHLTTLRLATGLGACGLVATGDPRWRVAAAILWLVSTFLDRADGELARVGQMMSEEGHRYDYLSDLWVNALIFAAAGVGARHGPLGVWSVGLGLLATTAMLTCWIAGEAYQRRTPTRAKPYPGRWGFDLDDGLYLLAPLIALGWMGPILIGTAAITTAMAGLILWRLARLGRPARSDAPAS